MEVTIFAFGMTPLFIKPLIEKVNQEKNKFDFSVILSSSHHLKLMNNLVGQENVICIDRQLPKFKNTSFELSLLSNYPDNIFKNIESLKKTINTKEIIKFLSEVYSVSSNFISGTPGDIRNDFMMTHENLDAFWNAFIEHTKRFNKD